MYKKEVAADELDMVDRDPFEINNHIRVAFHDIFGEPDGSHSTDCAWQCGYTCFSCSRNVCYKIMTALCAWFIGLYWGCQFAVIGFEHIWCFTPAYRVCAINVGCLQRFFGACISCFLTPICESCGMIFSKITITNQVG